MILPLVVLALLAVQAEGLAISGNPVGALGSTVTLYCYSSPQEWGVNWLTPYGRVINNPSRIPGSTLSVRIKSLKERDLGAWTCRANQNTVSAAVIVKLPGSDADKGFPTFDL